MTRDETRGRGAASGGARAMFRGWCATMVLAALAPACGGGDAGPGGQGGGATANGQGGGACLLQGGSEADCGPLFPDQVTSCSVKMHGDCNPLCTSDAVEDYCAASCDAACDGADACVATCLSGCAQEAPSDCMVACEGVEGALFCDGQFIATESTLGCAAHLGSIGICVE
jgi:hypothetical protein